MLNDRLRRSAAGPTTWRKGEDATLGWLRMLQLFGTCSNQVVIWNLHYGSRAAHVSGAANGRAPVWSITARGRCSLNSGRSLFPVETVVECQNGHLIEWLKPTPSNQRRTGGLNLQAVIRRRKPAAVAHQVGP